jgi:hypothetical protein
LILQNHQIHHQGNHHHQRDRIETRTTHPHDKRTMEKHRNRTRATANKAASDMENNARGEYNKSHNQTTAQTLHIEYNFETPDDQAITTVGK